MSTGPQTASPTPQIPTQQSDPVRAELAQMAGGMWGIFLLTGIAWLIISLAVLRFTTTSVTTIGVLMGVVFLGAMANEFLIAWVRRPWRWAHVLMGLIFLGGAIWAFVSPQDAFWTLATIIGALFILQGALVLITSVESRPLNDAWWLGVFAGVVEILIGFWASQQVLPARAALLIFYVGFLAMFRGISEIVLAFEAKGAQRELSRRDGSA
jgi:uncharacterized membrane protein HdeD (DUF308 family)